MFDSTGGILTYTGNLDFNKIAVRLIDSEGALLPTSITGNPDIYVTQNAYNQRLAATLELSMMLRVDTHKLH